MECLLGSMVKGLAAGNSQSWGGPGVQGVCGDRQVGAGEDSPRPTRDPRGREAWGPCCPVLGTGCVLLRVGWNSGLRARGQMGIYSNPRAEFLLS